MGRPITSLAGQRFGNLTVVRRADNPNNRQTKWFCICDCGQTCVAYGLNLKAGRTTSCGCKKNEIGRERIRKEQMRQGSVSLDNLKRDVNPYQNLANAIVAVAADDYRTALKDGDEELQASLERFFHSDWYGMLTNVSADTILGALRKEHSGTLSTIYI